MRIVFDHQVFGHHRFSGITRYLFEIASGMATQHREDVSIVAPLFINGYLRQAPAQLRVVGMAVPEFRRSGRLYRTINDALAKPLLKALQPDIVHETYYSFHRSAPASAKVILTVHDMAHERLPTVFSANDPTVLAKAAAVARADHVLCISENTRRDLIELLGIDPKKTSVIHHGFSLTVQMDGTKSSAEEVRPFLLYVSYRSGHKNFTGFMRAYASSSILREFDVVCFGGGPFGSDEHTLLGQLGVPAGRIRQAAGDDRVLATLYRNAAAFVYPSLYEGFGIPPLEAMSFDCPVACSNTSSMPEVVGDAALTFDPSNVEEMRSAIERAATDDAQRQLLVARGRDRLKLFSWERCTAETLDAYRRAL